MLHHASEQELGSVVDRVDIDLDRGLDTNTRALVLPGQIFANYTWGGTNDAILPRVTKRPVAVRYETPYGDPRATDAYAYACMAYELLMGEVLVDADTLAGLLTLHRGGGASARVRTAMATTPALGPLAAVLEPALSMDRERRPTVARLRADLRALGPELRRRPWPLTG